MGEKNTLFVGAVYKNNSRYPLQFSDEEFRDKSKAQAYFLTGLRQMYQAWSV